MGIKHRFARESRKHFKKSCLVFRVGVLDLAFYSALSDVNLIDRKVQQGGASAVNIGFGRLRLSTDNSQRSTDLDVQNFTTLNLKL